MLSRKHRPLVRFFNELIDHGEYYEKRSTKQDKLRDEYFFLSNVPTHLSSYYPTVSNFESFDGYSSYRIQKIFTDDASSLILNHQPESEIILINLLSNIKEYLKAVPSIEVSSEQFDSSILKDIFEKNLSRLKEILVLRNENSFDEICQEYGFQDVEHYCLVLNDTLKKKFKEYDGKKLFYSHGDLCLSNILPIEDEVFFVDPKGYQGDILNTFRAIHYDFAKLSHSLFGSYDKINNHQFAIVDNKIEFNDPPIKFEKLENEFKSLLKDYGVEFDTVRLIEASLFLSLIPFHQESRQKIKAFLINSLTIFTNHYQK